MNRNRKENARKKISKRVFIQCRAFFSCVFFFRDKPRFFFYCVNSIRWKKNKSKWKKKETWNAYASIVHRMKCRVSKIFKTAFYDIWLMVYVVYGCVKTFFCAGRFALSILGTNAGNLKKKNCKISLRILLRLSFFALRYKTRTDV